MKRKLIGYTILIIFTAFLFTACNPAEDKIVTKHTITNTKSINLYSDSIAGSDVVCTLNPGDEVFHPKKRSNGMVGVSLYKFGPCKGYIKAKYLSSDTTIITHSSVLRDEYDQEIVPHLDEKLDSFADWYLDWFPIDEGGFWTFAIILALGVAIFYGLSNTDVPLGVQLIALILYSPFVIWVAMNIHKYDMTQVDGFLFRLIIMLAFLAAAIFIVTAITASFGKLIGHNFTFKFSIWTTISIYIIYFGVAYTHSLCDFFFKFAMLVYGAFFIYYVVEQVMNMIRYAGFSLRSITRLLSNIIIFGLSIVLICSIMIPVQIISSVLITHLLGALLILVIPILFLGGIAANPSGEYRGSASAWEEDKPTSWHEDKGTKYEHEISGGLRRGTGAFDNNWYDSDGNKYEETSPGRYKKLD